MESNQKYAYRPLESQQREIRLLKLQPDLSQASAGSLGCTLVHVSLLSMGKVSYETVSYCWGDPTKRSYITVDGCLLELSANTAAVLRHLHRANRHQLLWIDGVCIDQSDLRERNQQVAMMNDIFASASHGIIWLGDDRILGDRAKKEIELVYADMVREVGEDRQLQDVTLLDDGERFSSTPISTAADYQVIRDFFSLPWFQRLWVIQEAALVPESTCFCGDIAIPLLRVLRSACWLWHKSRTLPFKIEAPDGILNAYMIWEFADHSQGTFARRSESGITLLDLLVKCRWAASSDPRDHVFGLLGMYRRFGAVKDLPAALYPNYAQPLHKVFRAATQHSFLETGDLSFLRHVDPRLADGDTDGPQLPSWVPKWHQAHIPRVHTAVLGDFFEAHNGRKMLQYIPREEESDTSDYSLLIVKGFIADECSFVSQKMHRTLFLWGFPLIAVIERLKDMLQRASKDETTVSSESTLAMTLCSGRGYTNQPVDPESALAKFQAFRAFVLRFKRLPPRHADIVREGWQDDEGLQNSIEYSYMLFNACLNRRFFTTAAGRAGLGGDVVECGDVVAIIYGCRWPVILHPRLEWGHYEFRGICYVHGIMFGEAVRQYELHQRHEEMLHIH